MLLLSITINFQAYCTFDRPITHIRDINALTMLRRGKKYIQRKICATSDEVRVYKYIGVVSFCFFVYLYWNAFWKMAEVALNFWRKKKKNLRYLAMQDDDDCRRFVC